MLSDDSARLGMGGSRRWALLDAEAARDAAFGGGDAECVDASGQVAEVGMVGVAYGEHLAALGIVDDGVEDGLAEVDGALAGVGVEQYGGLILGSAYAQQDGEVEHHGAVATILALEGLSVGSACGILLPVPIEGGMSCYRFDGVDNARMDSETNGDSAVATILIE